MTVPEIEPGDTLDPAYAQHLLETLIGSLPASPDSDTDVARCEAIRVAFRSMRPRTPLEAMLAAEVISAHYVIMDCFRLALSPETDPAAAARARSNAATQSRVRLATLRSLERQQAPARPQPQRGSGVDPGASDQIPQTGRHTEAPGPAEPAREPASTKLPPYVPRDRFGNQIPLWRWEYMTMAQRRAAYADPSEIGLRQAALAEEEAAIAMQANGEDTAVTPLPATPT